MNVAAISNESLTLKIYKYLVYTVGSLILYIYLFFKYRNVGCISLVLAIFMYVQKP